MYRVIIMKLQKSSAISNTFYLLDLKKDKDTLFIV